MKKIFGRAEANLKQTDEDRTEERGFTGNIRFNQIAQYSQLRYPSPAFYFHGYSTDLIPMVEINLGGYHGTHSSTTTKSFEDLAMMALRAGWLKK